LSVNKFKTVHSTKRAVAHFVSLMKDYIDPKCTRWTT